MAAVEPRDQLASPTVVSESDGLPLRERPLRVRWIGVKPGWLDLPGAVSALESIELDSSGSQIIRPSRAYDGVVPDVFHVTRSALRCLTVLRQAVPQGVIVVDLSGEGEGDLGWRSARQAAVADVILIGSLLELRELRRRFPSLAPRTALLRRPLDLDTHATRTTLLQSRGIELATFRQTHGLADPLILFAGPFTPAGGLDVALEALKILRKHFPESTLAAIPHGRVDRRYTKRCKRRVRNTRDVVFAAETPDAAELPFWYAAAHIVCLPCREGVGAEAARLAAAAGRPFVGTEVEPLLEHVSDGKTGFLVPLGDLDTLVAALEALVGDRDEARRLGDAARDKAERDFAPDAAATQLDRVWRGAVEERTARRASTNGFHALAPTRVS
jgi:glycosyltransferase involved in cell wall biosynthesis